MLYSEILPLAKLHTQGLSGIDYQETRSTRKKLKPLFGEHVDLLIFFAVNFDSARPEQADANTIDYFPSLMSASAANGQFGIIVNRFYRHCLKAFATDEAAAIRVKDKLNGNVWTDFSYFESYRLELDDVTMENS